MSNILLNNSKKQIGTHRIDEVLLIASFFSSLFFGVLTSFFSQLAFEKTIDNNRIEAQPLKENLHQNGAADVCSAMCFVSLAVTATSVFFLFKDSLKKTDHHPNSTKRVRHAAL